MGSRVSGYLFILPAVSFYLVFRLVPYLQSFWYGFSKWDGASPRQWVGLANYAEVVNDKYFWNAAGHNVIYTLMNLTIPLGGGLLLALLIAGIRRGQSIFRVVLFTPYVLSSAVVAIMWMQIYHPYLGIVNTGLKAIGLEELTRAWLGIPETALYAVNLANSWNNYGFPMVIYLAAVQAIDPTLYEAAKLDGANWFQLVRHVTLPGLRNSTTMLVSLAIMGSITAFTMVFIMTGGGPNFSSETLATYIYNKAFEELRMGYASAVSGGLAIWVLIVTVAFIRLRERGD